MLILQRKPKIVKAMAQLTAVGVGARRRSGAAPSSAWSRTWRAAPPAASTAWRTPRAARCSSASIRGRSPTIWEFRTSPLYSEAERVALDFAIAAASQPNGVTDEMFAEMRKHWSETQIVEIAAVVAVFGFLNRWNDTMGTPLEEEPIEVGEKYLARARLERRQARTLRIPGNATRRRPVFQPAVPPTAFRLTSPGIPDNSMLPPKNAGNFAKNPNCTGQNVSPPLAWSNAPDKTRSFAIIWDDQAGRAGLGVSHAVIYGIPANVTSFAEGELGGRRRRPLRSRQEHARHALARALLAEGQRAAALRA